MNPWGLPNPLIVSGISLIVGVAEKHFYIVNELSLFPNLSTPSLSSFLLVGVRCFIPSQYVDEILLNSVIKV